MSEFSTETANSGSSALPSKRLFGLPEKFSQAGRPIVLFAFASAIYGLCLRFLFPGYFAPLVPDHSDLYMPVGFLERSLAEVLTYPRPLTYVFLRTAGLLGLQGSILIVILAVIAAVLLAATLATRWAGARMSWMALACYLALVFAHPEFYFEHRHDSPVVLSCALVLLAAECWRRWLISNHWQPLAGCFAFSFALGLVKETYYLSLLVLLVTLAVAERRWQWKRVVPPMFALVALLGVCFLISAAGFRRWIPTGAVESYHISLNPPDLWRTFVYYLSHLFTWTSALAVLAALALAATDRRKLIVGCGMTLAGIAALIPNSVLPNHLFEQYSWLAAPFCFVPLLLLGSPKRVEGAGWQMQTVRWQLLALPAAVALAALSLWRDLPEYASTAHQWAIQQELENRGIVASFPRLRTLAPGSRVLVTGINTPLSPWIEPDFLKHEFGPCTWTVVIPIDRSASELPSVHLVHASDVQPAAFDRAFVYDDKGHLRQEYDHASLASASDPQREAIVVPELAPLLDQLRRAPDDHLALLNAGNVCLHWGLDQRAEAYLRRSLETTHGHDPYAFFFLGQLNERQHDPATAYADYQHAVETDQEPRNPAFQQAVDRLRQAQH